MRSASGIAAGADGHRVARGGVRGEEPRAGLGDEVVRGRLRERAVPPERGDDADHERRPPGVHVLPVEPEPRRPGRRRVVEDDVGGVEQRGERADPVVGLQVEHHRALAAVERHEEAAEPVADGHHAAVGVATGRLDLDHVGAELARAARRRAALPRTARSRPRGRPRAARSSQPQPSAGDHELLHLGGAARDRRADRRAIERRRPSLDRRRLLAVAEPLEAEQVDRSVAHRLHEPCAPASFAIAEVGAARADRGRAGRPRGTRAAAPPAARRAAARAARIAVRSSRPLSRSCASTASSTHAAPPTFSAVTRSKSSVYMSTSQPPSRSPTRFRAGISTPSRNVSQRKPPPSVAKVRTSIPGVSIGHTSTEIPRCFGRSGSVRTAR